MERKWVLLGIIISTVMVLSGCGTDYEIVNIPEEDLAIIPELVIMIYEEAMEAGGKEIKAENGTFLACEVIWHTVCVDGIEYYFYEYILEDGTSQLEPYASNYSIVGSQYSLKCGISIGDTAKEVIKKYPDLAKTDLSEEKRGYVEKYSCWGFNPVTYPNNWADQFDYALMANVIFDPGTRVTGELPEYLALMIKDEKVAAITFFYPTAS